MHCLECHAEGHDSNAVGVCHTCGAAVCAHHVRTVTRSVRHSSLVGTPGERQERTLLCPVCTEAHTPASAAHTR
ncbi:DUF2180 family protein (plasmid) [Streptomyces californicus]|uniref:DUF2180 family protein n=1 Tax=Streptomyces californicus TaxID=67351 RepID=A0ABD7D8L8_9ACTN|nr:DUF2180 family protein [Streptomyces californicus]QRV52639.1 DUF2180 family protein [Streptomyces californicus]